MYNVYDVRSDDSNPIKKDRGCLGYDRKEDYGIQTFGLFPEFTPRYRENHNTNVILTITRPKAHYVTSEIQICKRLYKKTKTSTYNSLCLGTN